MDLDQDTNQNDAQITSSNPSIDQAPLQELASDMEPKKLSVEERLDRLSQFRIIESQLEGAPDLNNKGGKADVGRGRFRRNEGAAAESVAVKKIRCDDPRDERFSKEFVHEVELLAKLSHQNIVQLIGFLEDLKHQKAWIVLRWEPNGNVREFLASGKWEIPERISLIKDMFNGLQYLHTRQPPICHGDLKSLNILVSSSYRAVITDFGSARVLRTDDHQVAKRDNMQHATGVEADAGDDGPEVTIVASTNQLTLTGPAWSLRWAAPELVKEEASPGLASDIWSAGWVCWEIMTNKVPFEHLRRDGAVMLKVIQGELPSIQQDAEVAQVAHLCSLMTDCWKYKPEQRIHVDECCREVHWMPSIPPFAGTPSGNKTLSPTLLLKMGRIHYSQARHEQAEALFKKVVTSTESGVHEGVVAEAMECLGDVYYAQCRDYKAEEFYVGAQEIYARIGNEHGRAYTVLRLGHVHRSQCKYAEAQESYARAQEIYARIGDDQGRANTIRGLADVYCTQCKYDEAEESYTRAQGIYARTGDDRGRAHTIQGLGDVYLAQSKYAQAEELHTRAQEIYARIGDDQGRAHTIRGLGHVYLAQSKYGEAQESYTRAQEVYARIDDDQGRAHTLWGLGVVYRAQSKYAEAEESFIRAQEIYARIGDDLGRANTLRSLAHLHRGLARPIQAASFYAKARDLYSHIGRLEDEDDASHWLGVVYDEGDTTDIAPLE